MFNLLLNSWETASWSLWRSIKEALTLSISHTGSLYRTSSRRPSSLLLPQRHHPSADRKDSWAEIWIKVLFISSCFDSLRPNMSTEYFISMTTDRKAVGNRTFWSFIHMFKNCLSWDDATLHLFIEHSIFSIIFMLWKHTTVHVVSVVVFSCYVVQTWMKTNGGRQCAEK